MNKNELISAMAERSRITKKDSAAAVDAFIDCVTDAMKKGDKVSLVGFGTFEAKVRSAREGRNPRTNEVVKIPETKAPTFKAGKALKDALN